MATTRPDRQGKTRARAAPRTRFVPPLIVARSDETPGITCCSYASCHTASSTTRLGRPADPEQDVDDR